MRTNHRIILFITAVSLLMIPSVKATVVSITSIFGTGNPDTGWWVNSSSIGAELQLGVRAKERTSGATTNDGAGTYFMPTGLATPTRAAWNFEFSISTAKSGDYSAKLSDYTYALSIDLDPSLAQSWTSFNPLVAYTDNTLGDASTVNGGGVVSTAYNLYSVAQNSQNWIWYGNPYLNGTYDFKLAAYDLTGLLKQEVDMRVVVGNGGSSVPDTASTVAMLGGAFLALAALRRKFVA